MRIEEPAAHVPVTRDCVVVASTDNVTAPAVAPPLRPVPAATEVMSPPLSASAEQSQPLPFHLGTSANAHESPPMVAASAENSALGVEVSSWRGPTRV